VHNMEGRECGGNDITMVLQGFKKGVRRVEWYLSSLQCDFLDLLLSVGHGAKELVAGIRGTGERGSVRKVM
jgi:hypothetical protein